MRLAALLIVAFLATASQARAMAIPTMGGPILVATSAMAVNLAQDQTPTTKHEVDINVNHGGRAWVSPVWIAIGVLALIVLILLIIMATRGGGGTTIVRE